MKYSQLTEEQKEKRRAYARKRNKKLATAGRTSGATKRRGPKMSEAEKKAKRRAYNANYRAQHPDKVKATHKAYRKKVQAIVRDHRGK